MPLEQLDRGPRPTADPAPAIECGKLVGHHADPPARARRSGRRARERRTPRPGFPPRAPRRTGRARLRSQRRGTNKGVGPLRPIGTDNHPAADDRILPQFRHVCPAVVLRHTRCGRSPTEPLRRPKVSRAAETFGPHRGWVGRPAPSLGPAELRPHAEREEYVIDSPAITPRPAPRPGDRLQVQIDVLPGAGGPRPVLPHARVDQLPPDLGLLVVRSQARRSVSLSASGLYSWKLKPLGAGPWGG